ncbi:MAG: hypothetical protein Kow0013_14770 [Pararhodobacter sp.]
MRALVILALGATPALADRLPGERSLSETPWGYGIVTAPTRAGAEAQRFEVRAGDCAANAGWDDCARDRERSEFRTAHEWAHGTEQWIGFSLFLPADFPSSPRVKTTLAQIHQTGGPARVAGGQTSHPPLMQMEVLGEIWRLTVHQPGRPNIHVDLAPLPALRGVWSDVQIGYDSRAGRHLEVWVNGTLRARVENWHTTEPDRYYFKYGVYRSFVSRHGGPMPTQVALFDEVRLGPDRASVAVDPAHPVD